MLLLNAMLVILIAVVYLPSQIASYPNNNNIETSSLDPPTGLPIDPSDPYATVKFEPYGSFEEADNDHKKIGADIAILEVKIAAENKTIEDNQETFDRAIERLPDKESELVVLQKKTVVANAALTNVQDSLNSFDRTLKNQRHNLDKANNSLAGAHQEVVNANQTLDAAVLAKKKAIDEYDPAVTVTDHDQFLGRIANLRSTIVEEKNKADTKNKNASAAVDLETDPAKRAIAQTKEKQTNTTFWKYQEKLKRLDNLRNDIIKLYDPNIESARGRLSDAVQAIPGAELDLKHAKEAIETASSNKKDFEARHSMAKQNASDALASEKAVEKEVQDLKTERDTAKKNIDDAKARLTPYENELKVLKQRHAFAESEKKRLQAQSSTGLEWYGYALIALGVACLVVVIIFGGMIFPWIKDKKRKPIEGKPEKEPLGYWAFVYFTLCCKKRQEVEKDKEEDYDVLLKDGVNVKKKSELTRVELAEYNLERDTEDYKLNVHNLLYRTPGGNKYKFNSEDVSTEPPPKNWTSRKESAAIDVAEAKTKASATAAATTDTKSA